MTTRVRGGALLAANGVALQGVKVVATIEGADFAQAPDGTIFHSAETTTDSTGEWRLDLYANDVLEPEGTTYRLEERGYGVVRIRHLVVPDVSAVDADDIATDDPADDIPWSELSAHILSHFHAGIDGGAADEVYVAGQTIDGGSA